MINVDDRCEGETYHSDASTIFFSSSSSWETISASNMSGQITPMLKLAFNKLVYNHSCTMRNGRQLSIEVKGQSRDMTIIDLQILMKQTIIGPCRLSFMK